jgi:hypothetical protein
VTFDFLHRYYSRVAPNAAVLELCGAPGGLKNGDLYLDLFVRRGWKLLRHR